MWHHIPRRREKETNPDTVILHSIPSTRAVNVGVPHVSPPTSTTVSFLLPPRREVPWGTGPYVLGSNSIVYRRSFERTSHKQGDKKTVYLDPSAVWGGRARVVNQEFSTHEVNSRRKSPTVPVTFSLKCIRVSSFLNSWYPRTWTVIGRDGGPGALGAGRSSVETQDLVQ